MESNEKTKKILFNLIGWVIGILVVVLIRYFFFQTPNIPSDSVDALLVNVAKEINKSCPMQMDKITSLTTTIALPDRVLQYNYTINLDKDSMDIDKILDTLEPQLINGVKTNPEMKQFRDDNVTLSYSYADRNGVFLFKIDVTPDKYK